MPRRYSTAQVKAIEDALELVRLYGISMWEIEGIEFQLQRERQRARECAAYIARQLVEFWGITPSDLRRPAPPLTKAAPAVKYVHPATDDSWDGTGPQPEWLRQALLRDGYRVADLLPSMSAPAPDERMLADQP